MCLFDHSFDDMLDITKDVVQVPIARILMGIVGTGCREHAFVSTFAHKVLTDVGVI